MNNEKLQFMGMSIDDTCKKCRFGNILFPTDLFCAEYKQKPYSVVFKGESCPKFQPMKNNKNSDIDKQ